MNNEGVVKFSCSGYGPGDVGWKDRQDCERERRMVVGRETPQGGRGKHWKTKRDKEEKREGRVGVRREEAKRVRWRGRRSGGKGTDGVNCRRQGHRLYLAKPPMPLVLYLFCTLAECDHPRANFLLCVRICMRVCIIEKRKVTPSEKNACARFPTKAIMGRLGETKFSSQIRREVRFKQINRGKNIRRWVVR